MEQKFVAQRNSKQDQFDKKWTFWENLFFQESEEFELNSPTG